MSHSTTDVWPGSRHDDQVDSISQALNQDNSFWIWEKLAG
jgi:hypothetical protein